MLEVFFVKVQLLYCKVLNFIWKYTKKISEKNRERGLRTSFMAVCICAYLYSILPISVHLLIKCIIGTICMFGILVFSIDRELKPVQWNKILVVLWAGIGGLQLISGIMVSKEYFPFAFIWLIGYTMLFFVWNNRRDYHFLIKNIYYSFLFPASAFFLLSILFAPIQGGYCAITGNANSVGQHVAAIFPLAIGFFLFSENAKKTEKIINGIIIALSIGFVFFSSGRTATITILAILFVAILYILVYESGKRKCFATKFIFLLLGTVLIIGVIYPLNKVSTSVLPNYEYEMNVQQKNKDLDNVLETYVDRMQGKDKAKSDIQNYSSGRIGIWEEAIKKTTLLGHPSADHIVTLRNGDVGNNAHNVFIQVSYDNGVFTGILYFLLVISGGILTIKRMIENKEQRKLYMMLFLIQISFVCVAMFASVNLPFLYEITFLYYCVYIVLFDTSATIVVNEKNIL